MTVNGHRLRSVSAVEAAAMDEIDGMYADAAKPTDAQREAVKWDEDQR